MKELVTIVIPIFNNQLSEAETKSLEQCLNVLGQFPILFITGDDSNLDEITKNYPSIAVYRFESAYFKNRSTFQNLLVKDDFYDRFDWSEFLLVHELNTFILKNELRYWCKQGFDFIQLCPNSLTSDWQDSFFCKKIAINTIEELSSNGLSLRRVGPMRKAIKKNKRALFQFFSTQERPVEAVFWEERNHKIWASLITPTPVVRKRFARHSKNFVHPDELFSITGITDATNL